MINQESLDRKTATKIKKAHKNFDSLPKEHQLVIFQCYLNGRQAYKNDKMDAPASDKATMDAIYTSSIQENHNAKLLAFSMFTKGFKCESDIYMRAKFPEMYIGR